MVDYDLNQLQLDITNGSKEDAIRWTLELFENNHILKDHLFEHAKSVIDDWFNHKIKVSDARREAFLIHEQARACQDPYQKQIYRAYGHLMATIHVKEHALRCYQYLLKAQTIKRGRHI